MTPEANLSKCPLCGEVANSVHNDPSTDTNLVVCGRCGKFRITYEMRVGMRTGDPLSDEQRCLLSACCRRVPEGADPPLIDRTTIDGYIRSLPRYTVPESLDNLLDLIARMSPPEFGKPSNFNPTTDYPLAIMRSAAEVRSYVGALTSRDYVTQDPPYTVRMKGWERLEEVKRSGRQSSQAFVAMWFHRSQDEVYERAIKPAIEEAGYKALRVDRHEHVNRIDDEIIGQIRRSRFMVADFTNQNPGVHFEAGMMLGLGRTVIWMCEKKELDEGKAHFDVRQFNFIPYESPAEAKERLYNRIVAIEGEGPNVSDAASRADVRP